MPPDVTGDIRVFVQWTSQAVFAGEEIKCRITFKNVASDPSVTSSVLPVSNGPRSSPASAGERTRQFSPFHTAFASPLDKPGVVGLTPSVPASNDRSHGHRSTLSLNTPHSSLNPTLRNDSVSWSPRSNAPDRSSHHTSGHKRSISIVSIASNSTIDDRASAANANSAKLKRATRGHARSSSLQILPRGAPGGGGPHTATLPLRQSLPLGSPQYNASYPPDRRSHSRRTSGVSTVPNTPATPRQPSPKGPPGVIPEFRFPALKPLSPGPVQVADQLSGTSSSAPKETVSQRPKNSELKSSVPMINENTIPPATKVLVAQSISGDTPRSSGEFYAMSNNSNETLASEYPSQPRLGWGSSARPPHMRKHSNLSPLGQHSSSQRLESIMMAYAQVQGSFTLDGSLINLGPFDQVKRKAVVGGQGGGVVGVESTRQNGGLLRGFGLGNLLDDLVGGGELSTIKEMRGVANAKSIPLLSTPQSILFVDAKLGPGDSKAFDYSFRLPRGLPPSHKGKAIKIMYTLVVGTQRAGGSREQQVRTVEVPFRVLGSVNSHGEILGHDLMSPYVLLSDKAVVQAVGERSFTRKTHGNSATVSSAPNEFFMYVDELLNQSKDTPGVGLLSPTDVTPGFRRSSAFEEAITTKEAIDMAILRSNITDGQQSANRFEIARNGLRVGMVMLVRPTYRLGEVVIMVVDFSQAQVPCYAVHATLETAEKIDHSLALRSEASVHRVTRKVYMSSSETTLYSRRMVFTPTIPITATPEFVTSGVSFEWKLRLEFVVPAHESLQHQMASAGQGQQLPKSGPAGDMQDVYDSESSMHTATGTPAHHLLEEISNDDRGGLILAAAENLICESFEVVVPLRVYGTVATGLEKLERDEALEEGLVI